LTRWQRAARYACLLGLHGARRLRQGRAQEMAAALAFRTLFGLLPVLVVATLLVRAFQGWERFRATAAEFVGSLGLGRAAILVDDGGSSVSLAAWLLKLLDQVETINLSAIGWIGVVVLVYSAVGLMTTIENSFNSLYGAPCGRSWTRRFPNYWFVLCLAPAAVGVALYLDDHVVAVIQTLGAWDWLSAAMGRAWSLGVAWLIVFMVYRVVPNTTVATRPAMIGAAVAALLLYAGKATLGAYLTQATSLRQLYGSLGLIPVFMFWTYLMWLVVLYGLELAATLQTVSRRELEEDVARQPGRSRGGIVDPTALLGVMGFVAQRFREGRAALPREIADDLGLPDAAVDSMLARLGDAGLLHRLEREHVAVTLARPPESISADRLIQIGFELVDEGRPERRTPLVERLRAAQREVASRATLATLLSE